MRTPASLLIVFFLVASSLTVGAQVITDEVQVVEGLGGKVGIGATPTAPLTVEGVDDTTSPDIIINSPNSLIKLGPGQGGPHGILFGDSGPEGMQFLYRSGPNQLVVEKGNDGSDGEDLFSINYDNDQVYFKGRMGVGTGPSSNANIISREADFSVSEAGTNYRFGIVSDVRQTFNIPSGVTDSGYRIGLDIRTHVSDADFNGTLNNQYGIRVQYGTYTGVGSGQITNVFGLYLQGLSNPNATVTNRYGIYQNSAADVNYFAGNTGIGTSSPEGKLDVSGSFYSGTGAISVRKQNSSTEGGELELLGAGSHNPWSIDNFMGRLRTHHSGNAYFQLMPDGKVGIGSATPKAILDVTSFIENGALGAVFGRLPEGNGSNSGTFLGVRGYGTQPIDSKSFAIEHSFYGQTNSSINFFRGDGASGGFVTINTDTNIERVRIDSDGNVGIGIAPSFKLHVVGDVRGNRFISNTQTYADFVFEDDYQLTPLSEVEQFIKKNKHLPDVPAEAEVMENGIDLAAMNVKLLQKVEELTLYIIEQNKRIEALEKKESAKE